MPNVPTWLRDTAARFAELVADPEAMARVRAAVRAEVARCAGRAVRFLPAGALTLDETLARLSALHDYAAEHEANELKREPERLVDPWAGKPPWNWCESAERGATPEQLADLKASLTYCVLCERAQQLIDADQPRIARMLDVATAALTPGAVAQPTATAPANRAGAGGLALDPTEAAILKALDGKRLRAVEIVADIDVDAPNVPHGDGLVKARLRKLEKVRLVERPDGERAGYALTAAGTDILNRL